MKKYLFTFICCLIILLYIPFNTLAENYQASGTTYSYSIASKSLEFANYTNVSLSLVSDYSGGKTGSVSKTYNNNSVTFNYNSSVNGSRASKIDANIKDFSSYENYYNYNTISLDGTGSLNFEIPSDLNVSEFDVGFDIINLGTQSSSDEISSGFINITKSSNSFSINYKLVGRKNYSLFTYSIVPYLYYNSNPSTNTYTLTLNSNNNSYGSVSGGGTYEEGSIITISANPNSGYKFDNWSDGSIENPRNININSDISLTANFSQIEVQPNRYTLSLNSNNSNYGSVSGSGIYDDGSTVTITATPNSGYKFDNWSDGSIENPRNIIINSDISLTANFSQINISDNAIIYQVINTIQSIDCNYSYTSGNTDYYRTTLNYIQEIRFIGDFDVYVKDGNVYKSIMTNIHSFSLFTNKKLTSSDSKLGCPLAPNVPNNTYTIYGYDLVYDIYLFKHHDNSNNIIVKAPDTDKLLSDGNTNSQSATSNNNQSNQLLDNTVNQMESLENGFKNDLNTNLENINANDFNISGITQLSNAAKFVRIQFDNLTKNNPFGIILGFSLFLGLSLLIIGKRL